LGFLFLTIVVVDDVVEFVVVVVEFVIKTHRRNVNSSFSSDAAKCLHETLRNLVKIDQLPG
jgi:hypothetical protein